MCDGNAIMLLDAVNSIGEKLCVGVFDIVVKPGTTSDDIRITTFRKEPEIYTDQIQRWTETEAKLSQLTKNYDTGITIVG